MVGSQDLGSSASHVGAGHVLPQMVHNQHLAPDNQHLAPDTPWVAGNEESTQL